MPATQTQPTIRTLLTLHPGQTADGRQVLKGILTKSIETIGDDGERRAFPAGTELVLRKTKVGSYQLLGIIDPVDHEERRRDFEAARREAIENPPEVDIPF